MRRQSTLDRRTTCARRAIARAAHPADVTAHGLRIHLARRGDPAVGELGHTVPKLQNAWDSVLGQVPQPLSEVRNRAAGVGTHVCRGGEDLDRLRGAAAGSRDGGSRFAPGAGPTPGPAGRRAGRGSQTHPVAHTVPQSLHDAPRVRENPVTRLHAQELRLT